MLYIKRNTFRAHLLFSTGVMRAGRRHISGGAAVLSVCPPCPGAPAQVGCVPDPMTGPSAFPAPQEYGSAYGKQGVWILKRGLQWVMCQEIDPLPGIVVFSRLQGSQGESSRWTLLSSLYHLQLRISVNFPYKLRHRKGQSLSLKWWRSLTITQSFFKKEVKPEISSFVVKLQPAVVEWWMLTLTLLFHNKRGETLSFLF